MKESSLEELKKDYKKIEQKYKLPSFQELNEDFDIEKVAERETDMLLREIRKTIMDKVIAYLRFIEMLLNPSNAPMFFFALVKSLKQDDKKELEKIYGKICSLEIDAVELDCQYKENKEAEFIKKINKDWKTIKKDVLKIVVILKKNWHQKTKNSEKGYLG